MNTEEKILELLWDYLKKDPEHKDRRQTGWGTKTKEGLLACIYRIAKEDPPQIAQAAVVKEFIGDVDAVGITKVRKEWPDLSLTYDKAKKLTR